MEWLWILRRIWQGQKIDFNPMGKPYPKCGPYNIIADTNALRAQDSRKLVSAGFEAALAELRKLTTIQLYIPDVVVGELAYQKFEMVVAAIEAINSKLTVLGQITGAKRPTVCSVEQAKKAILRRYSAWCKTNNARRFVSKVRQATWNRIVEDAVWRITPFERSEDRRHEKGCLYWKEKIHERVTSRLEDLLPPPADPNMALFEPKIWDRQTEERITLGTTQFEKREGGRIYWKTEVKSAAAFSGKAFLDMLQENIRISTFAVHWSSETNSNAEIKDAKFESIVLAGRQMIPDKVEARTQWALPAKPASPPAALSALEELLKGLPSAPVK